MMKTGFIAAVLLSALVTKGQLWIDSLQRCLGSEKNCLFLVCRGTTGKAIIIPRNFNLSDTNISHIGIGFIDGNSLVIYHVADIYQEKSALRIESLQSFVGAGDVCYMSVWRAAVNPGELKKIKQACEKFYKRRIVFDSFFQLSDDDTLYCSEFCIRVLSNADIARFRFMPINLNLANSLYAHILKREQLSYYPVDFFRGSKYFTKFFEYRIRKL